MYGPVNNAIARIGNHKLKDQHIIYDTAHVNIAQTNQ